MLYKTDQDGKPTIVSGQGISTLLNNEIGAFFQSANLTVQPGRVRCDGGTHLITQSLLKAFQAFTDSGGTTQFNANPSLCSGIPWVTFQEYETIRISNVDANNNGNCGFFGYDQATGQFRAPMIAEGTVLAQAVMNGSLMKWYLDAIRDITASAEFQVSGNTGLLRSASGAFSAETSMPYAFASTTIVGGSPTYKYLQLDASEQVPTAEETRNKQIRYPFYVVVENYSLIPEELDIYKRTRLPNNSPFSSITFEEGKYAVYIDVKRAASLGYHMNNMTACFFLIDVIGADGIFVVSARKLEQAQHSTIYECKSNTELNAWLPWYLARLTIDQSINNLSIYLDAINGDDANDGTSSDKPVKTSERAAEIINAINIKTALYIKSGTYSGIKINAQAPNYVTINASFIQIFVEGSVQLTRGLQIAAARAELNLASGSSLRVNTTDLDAGASLYVNGTGTYTTGTFICVGARLTVTSAQFDMRGTNDVPSQLIFNSSRADFNTARIINLSKLHMQYNTAVYFDTTSQIIFASNTATDTKLTTAYGSTLVLACYVDFGVNQVSLATIYVEVGSNAICNSATFAGVIIGRRAYVAYGSRLNTDRGESVIPGTEASFVERNDASPGFSAGFR